MVVNTKFETLIFEASSAKNASSARKFLLDALDICKKEQIEFPLVHKAKILAQLAQEEVNPNMRAKRWRQAISVANTPKTNTPEYKVLTLIEAAFAAVYCLQDSYAAFALGEKLSLARSLDIKLKDTLRVTEVGTQIARLLLVRAKLARFFCRHDIGHEQTRQRLERAVRWIGAALKLNPDPHFQFEMALLEWALSRYEKSDRRYADRLRSTEKLLNEIKNQCGPLAFLELARLYKSTYRGSLACKAFVNYCDHESNLRRKYRSAGIFSESVISMHYSGDSEGLMEYKDSAWEFSAKSIGMGCGTARELVNQCFLSAIRGELVQSKKIFAFFLPDSKVVDWQAVEDISNI